MSAHRDLLWFERAGTSRLLTWRGLPAGCDTVFFPGCSLPGTRPQATLEVFRRLRQTIPGLGVVLDCCTKPSYDLGRVDHFEKMFGELKGFLLRHGIKRVLVACPSCWKVFSAHFPEVRVETVYEALPGRVSQHPIAGTVTIHDPCAMRFATDARQAVRGLLGSLGLHVREMPHSGENTLCCGEGGGAACIAPEFSVRWGERRAEEVGEFCAVTYCAGCANQLSSRMAVSHVLDFLADPVGAQNGKLKISRGLSTYWNRFRLKSRLKREVSAVVAGVRAKPDGDSPG